MLILVAKVITCVFLYFHLPFLLSEDYLCMSEDYLCMSTKTKRRKKSFVFFLLQLSEVLSPISFFLYSLFKNKSKSNTERGKYITLQMKVIRLDYCLHS